MFGGNLVLFHRHLRTLGLLENAEQSIFYRSDEEFAHFLEAHQDSLALTPVSYYGHPSLR